MVFYPLSVAAFAGRLFRPRCLYHSRCALAKGIFLFLCGVRAGPAVWLAGADCSGGVFWAGGSCIDPHSLFDRGVELGLSCHIAFGRAISSGRPSLKSASLLLSGVIVALAVITFFSFRLLVLLVPQFVFSF